MSTCVVNAQESQHLRGFPSNGAQMSSLNQQQHYTVYTAFMELEERMQQGKANSVPKFLLHYSKLR